MGYAYRDQLAEGERIGTEVMHVEVSQLRQRSQIETRTDVFGDATGTPKRVRVTTTSKGNPTATHWFDAQRAPPRQGRLYGATLKWEPCAESCDAPIVRPFDLMARLVVLSPFRIPPSAHGGPIRYVMSRADAAVPRLPITGEQAVALDGSKAIVTVCATCGASDSITEAERQRYLQPNAWVQSDYAGIKAFASRNSGAGTTDQIMRQLVEGVQQHMTGAVDYLHYASAREALRTKSGDCTEFAVLLAAAARVRGIPTRVVSGLVYADRFSGKKDVFSPHSWVQAWNGSRWVSYDAGLGEFDATHIVLGVGNGDPRDNEAAREAPGQWRIERLGLVRTD